MTKTKHLLYAFKSADRNTSYCYWYETDQKYFKGSKPPKKILETIDTQRADPIAENHIVNPWNDWESNDIQKIMTAQGVCINYLKSTDSDLIQKQEDLKLLELYSDLVESFDISKSFGFNILKKWHKIVLETIYAFAGELRTVEMSKGKNSEAWTWRLDFLQAIPQLDALIKEISKKNYEKVETITADLSRLLSEFLFIHPFREGNGRISRLLGDIILAKNAFPMIGLNLKSGDNYIQKVHEGYNCNYEPLQLLLIDKIEEEIRNG
jgi:cell filamentation protein